MANEGASPLTRAATMATMATNGLTLGLPPVLHTVSVTGSSLNVLRGLQLGVLRCLGNEIEAAPFAVLCSARRLTWSAPLASSTSVSSISTPDSDPADGDRSMSSLVQLQYPFRRGSAAIVCGLASFFLLSSASCVILTTVQSVPLH